MMMMRLRLLSCVAVPALSIALAAPAFAQNTQTTPADATTQDQGVSDPNEIVVTAQGRAQVLADVPLAVSAVTSTQLERTGANDIRALNQVAPSLLVSSTGSDANTSARIRGVGTVGDNPGLESSVATFIDGVYRSRTGLGLNDLGEIERIEVLRGPQGTLYGRNTIGGAIKYVTGKIEGDPEIKLRGNYGSYDQKDIIASAKGQVND
eukprot:TRINITY_DN10386_c0_g4_i1.p1 TRINITY_DN10386_c0_g4~~TRINITY_DN10386_c0_g4_i1.p1  ORF type:complete len:208 (+),score=48.25 TRINITY_DN10386_c0_g4_i1:302-925(+)